MVKYDENGIVQAYLKILKIILSIPIDSYSHSKYTSKVSFKAVGVVFRYVFY